MIDPRVQVWETDPRPPSPTVEFCFGRCHSLSYCWWWWKRRLKCPGHLSHSLTLQLLPQLPHTWLSTPKGLLERQLLLGWPPLWAVVYKESTVWRSFQTSKLSPLCACPSRGGALSRAFCPALSLSLSAFSNHLCCPCPFLIAPLSSHTLPLSVLSEFELSPAKDLGVPPEISY